MGEDAPTGFQEYLEHPRYKQSKKKITAPKPAKSKKKKVVSKSRKSGKKKFPPLRRSTRLKDIEEKKKLQKRRR